MFTFIIIVYFYDLRRLNNPVGNVHDSNIVPELSENRRLISTEEPMSHSTEISRRIQVNVQPQSTRFCSNEIRYSF